MTPEREKEIRAILQIIDGSECYLAAIDLLAEVDQQRKSLTIVRGLLETACEEMLWNRRQWQEAKNKLDLAMKALEEFADYETEPEYYCWPKSEYMNKSREALKQIRGEE